uniref:RING-type E3 ubiquitin transferase n=1 Tax=Kalanchoe fedtschenkoi TaxID=63787 RepID=A0A7N0VMX2_KALFE
MSDEERKRWWQKFPGGDDDGSASLNTRIMIIAVISLSSVILLVLALHIYARFVLVRRVRRRRAAAVHRLLQYSQSQPGHPHSAAADPKPGLSPAVVAALPTSKFKNLTPGGGEKMECSVCLSSLEDEEVVRQLPNCSHAFHVECIDKWFEFNSSCPLCRTEAEPMTSPSAPPVADIETGGGDLPPVSASKVEMASVASTSRLNSFRRMLSRERSSRRQVQPSAPEMELCPEPDDVERQ